MSTRRDAACPRDAGAWNTDTPGAYKSAHGTMDAVP
jgi:hypothetical protein